MPKVRDGEDRKSFIVRCVPQVMKEGVTQKEAVGRCEDMFSSAKRGGIAKLAKGDK